MPISIGLPPTDDMQMLLDGGDRQNALMRILQLQSRLLRLDGPRLDEEDAGDDLQAVGDAVLHLLQQHVLFPQQLLHLPLDGAPIGNVLECQQHGAVGALLIKNLARIQEHDALTDRRKLAVDLISLDGCLTV